MLKNFIIRLLAYPFSVFIIFLGYKMSFDNPYDLNSIYYGKSKFSGVFGIAIGLVYLVSDIAYQIKKAFFKNKN